jgi:hypothetical protein
MLDNGTKRDLGYRGYSHPQGGDPDRELTAVGRGTPVSAVDGDLADPAALLDVARRTIPEYIAAPPLREWTRPIAARSSAAE